MRACASAGHAAMGACTRMMDGGRRGGWRNCATKPAACGDAAVGANRHAGAIPESLGMCVSRAATIRFYFLAVRRLVGAPAQFEDAASGAPTPRCGVLASQKPCPPRGRYRIIQGREV